MYVNKNPYAIAETMKMHERCSSCGLKYKIEPNFFFGAMYVSYAFAVAVGIAVFAISFFAFDAGMKESFIAIIILLLILMPVITRLSRNAYINMFVHYDPKAAANHRTD